jgi:hypothetical protein
VLTNNHVVEGDDISVTCMTAARVGQARRHRSGYRCRGNPDPRAKPARCQCRFEPFARRRFRRRGRQSVRSASRRRPASFQA